MDGADQRFDGNHLGVAGHSRGGKIAFLAATRSTRIKAVFGLDPVDAAGGPGAQPSADFPSVAPELMPRVTVPVAIIGSAYGGTTASPLAPACAPVEDNYHQYTVAATAAVSVREWVAPASGHNDFADPLPFLLSLVCRRAAGGGRSRGSRCPGRCHSGVGAVPSTGTAESRIAWKNSEKVRKA